MCFSARVSALTYAIGMVGTIALWHHGFQPEAVFYGVVIQMQLIEFILWKTQPDCGRLNHAATLLGMVVNHLEPIALYLALIYFSRPLPIWVHITMGVFVIVSIIYTATAMQQEEGTCTRVTPQSCPHLYWAWNTHPEHARPYYIFFLICLVLLSLYGLGDHGRTNAVLLFVSFVVSHIIYGSSHSTGAMWCFAAAFGPVLLLLLCKPCHKMN